MAVFRYTATTVGEQHTESGTVIADNEQTARKKLKALKFGDIRLKRMSAISGLFNRFSATVK